MREKVLVLPDFSLAPFFLGLWKPGPLVPGTTLDISSLSLSLSLPLSVFLPFSQHFINTQGVISLSLFPLSLATV